MSNSKRMRSAGGWSAIAYSLKLFLRAGPFAMLRAMLSRNACKSCALGMGGRRGGMRDESGRFPSLCNKSVQAQAGDMQAPIPGDFFLRHGVESLQSLTPLECEHAGRITQPLICRPGDTHYSPLSWEEALSLAAERLRATSPDRSFFYFSGRSSNEAGFLLQLLARIYGTNNVNNCSYYCHQASGVGLNRTIGTGTATLQLEDLFHADLIFLFGANPPSNHPRFMTLLMELRRRGGRVIVVNPAREPGLENFSVPSDVRSLLFGSDIASTYIQPHIGGDIAVCKGIAKELLRLAENAPDVLDEKFIAGSTEDFAAFRRDIESVAWEEIEQASGVGREVLQDAARQYAKAKNVVFAWAMGLTHHEHGVWNVESLVNLALLRGMVGRKHAGLLPLRGHSNVQGIGSVGVTPQLKRAILDNLQSLYSVTLPQGAGMDTLACMTAADAGGIDFAWNLGGNLYGSNPDSLFAERALARVGFVLYMNTTLNQGHFRGRGQTTLILPVLARDEEPEPTTQESMFNYVRLSEGGPARHEGPRSEIQIIADIAGRAVRPGPIPWQDLRHARTIRQIISSVVPGFEKMRDIDRTGSEFHISGRILHAPEFATASRKAKFTVRPTQPIAWNAGGGNSFRLMTVRSEGQFNTVVYETGDKYRGVDTRDVVLMNREDMSKLGLREGDRVGVTSRTGRMAGQAVVEFPIRAGNVMMFYPEANVLVPRACDVLSKTPPFKSVEVTLTRE